MMAGGRRYLSLFLKNCDFRKVLIWLFLDNKIAGSLSSQSPTNPHLVYKCMNVRNLIKVNNSENVRPLSCTTFIK